MKRTYLFFIFFVFLFSFAFSATINIPSDYSTIQAGIDAASDGDTVLVGPGVYNENIQINKDLIIGATHGPENTSIDGNSGTGFNIEPGSPGEIKGFTILNCDNGIKISQSWNYTISNCIIKNNVTAIFSRRETKLMIFNNLIINNSYGVHQDYYGLQSFVYNCTFFGNTTYDIYWNPYWTEKRIIFNNSILTGEISCRDATPVYLNFCRYENGSLGSNVHLGQGNITEDPMFVDLDNGDYNLQTTSPCIDAGDPTSFYNDNDGTPNDMGYTGGNHVFINHSSFDFGYCASGSVKNDIFIISNKSENTITLNSFNSSDAQFSVNDVFPLTIDSGSEQDLTLSFTPDVSGQCSGIITFNVTGLAGSSSAAITVEGYGIDYTSGSINVPSIAPTIQSAIDLISISDTIFIAPGTYIENIRFNHKSPIIVGTAGAESTIISAGPKPDGSSGNAFYIDGGGGELHGLSITNANLAIYIYGDQDYPLIKDCKIFSNNTAIGFQRGSGLEIVRTLIYSNETGFHQHYYGGSSLITNCTFDNTQDIRFEPGYGTTCNLNVHNSILCGQISGHDLNPVNLYYSDFDPSKTGVNVNSVTSNITDDPMFVDLDNGDYNLQTTSPCIDAGDPTSFYNDSDGSRNDMGYTGGNHVFINHSSFNFGYCASGSVKNDVFIISNNSENTITLNNFNSSDAQFSVDGVFPLTIDSGSEQDLTLSFTPDVSAQCSGIIIFNVTGLTGSSSAAITVEGYGIDYTSGSINVPSIAPTIQSAIDLISIGDTIFVALGTYIENIRFNHKSPVIIGTAGAESTIISAGSIPDGSSGNAFYIDGGGGELHGLSITNANLAVYIYGDQDYPLIKDCKIFSNNTAISFRSGSGLEIVRTLIYNNETGFHQHYYGGSSLITNCTFDNTQDIRFEPSYGTTCNLNIHNSILCGQISGHDLNPVNLYYCNIDSSKTGVNVNSVTGNITDDPLFISLEKGNYHISVNSPCINTGNPDLNGNGNTWLNDVDDQDPDGTRLDIGAYYLHHIIVSLPDIEFVDEDTVCIPVSVEFHPDSAYCSAAMSFSGFQGYFEFLGLNIDNTIIDNIGWTYQYNENDSALVIWMAGPSDINSKGVLFYLDFYIPDSITGPVPITITSATFNEDYYPTALNSGNISVYIIEYGDVSRNGEISPYDASLILKYLIGVEQLNSYQTLNANVSLDSTISAMDASLILQYGVGLIDTLPYEPVGGELLASGNFSMSDQEFGSGNQIEIPIQLSQGDNILSFEGDILYNPDHLEYITSEWSELLEGFFIEIDDQAGHIKFAGAGSEPDGNAGVFTTLIFIEKSGCPDETEVELNRIRLNEDNERTEVSVCHLVKLVGIQTENTIPSEYSLSQNYPNPFNPTTTFKYDTPKESKVVLSLYDINGRLINTLVNEKQQPGYYLVHWDASQYSSGVYIYRIQADGFSAVKKCILIK